MRLMLIDNILKIYKFSYWLSYFEGDFEES